MMQVIHRYNYYIYTVLLCIWPYSRVNWLYIPIHEVQLLCILGHTLQVGYMYTPLLCICIICWKLLSNRPVLYIPKVYTVYTSNIVLAVYTYILRASEQNFNLNEGLSNSLLVHSSMLRLSNSIIMG